MSRLARDRAGNTLAMMAIALIPLSAMAGSGLDMARLYVVKVRLQQACDAGVLAGRKFMADGTTGQNLDPYAATQAQLFFANNFPTGWMTTRETLFTPKRGSDGRVSGGATTKVSMTVMKMFQAPDVKLDVTCEARYDVPDVDVMFVLDTTGSMACAASETSGCSQPIASYTKADGSTGYYVTEKSTSKIKALRNAAMVFWDTLDQSSDPSTNIRYGIVPYSSAVNVGYQLPAGSMVSDWQYQSRRVVGDANKNSAVNDRPSVNKAQCDALEGRSPANGYDSNGEAVVTTTSWDSGNNRCDRRRQTVIPLWRYAQWPMDVSQYILGNPVTDPSKVTGVTSRWQGCVEERDTVAATSFSASALPPDLDPDLPPTSDATRWRPMYGEQVYYRGSPASYDSTGNAPNLGGDASYLQSGYGTCPKSVRRLAKAKRSDISNFLNAADFRPLGGTYHDVGMIWGLRLISPTGIFAADTAAWPNRPAPRRHIVFMTDGEMAPNADIYGQYAHERVDRRVSGGNLGDLENRHTARFSAVCDAARNRNVTVWVVAFGSSLTNELRDCATTPSQAFFAGTDDELEEQFKSIAKQVAMLRVSQ